MCMYVLRSIFIFDITIIIIIVIYVGLFVMTRIFLCDCKYAVSRFTKHLKNTLCINVLWMFIFDARASLLFNFGALLKPWTVGMMMLEGSHCL